ASGDSGSGNRASSTVRLTPDRLLSTSRSPVEPGGSPVCAGLTTATRSPRAAARAATAAVTTVLPTSVPVPLTTSTGGSREARPLTSGAPVTGGAWSRTCTGRRGTTTAPTRPAPR